MRRIDPNIEILTLVHRFEVPGDVGDAFEPGDDRIQVDLQRPGECGGGHGMSDLPWAIETQIDRRAAVETMKHEP